MRRLLRFRADAMRDDAGMGLIMVIGISVFIFAIAATAISVAVNSMSQSRQRDEFETSLALAETGVDRVLSLVQGAYDATNSDYPVPSPAAPICPSTEIAYPPAGNNGAGGVWTDAGGKTAEENERDWARGILDTIAAIPACVQHEAAGEYVVFKPPSDDVKYGRVYSLAAMPSFAVADRTRLLKSEYIFMPYRPMHAVLSGGTVNLGSSSTEIIDAAGVPVGSASVHANGVVKKTGNPTVSGTVTYSGTGGSFGTGGTPLQRIPEVSARRFYFASYDTKTATAPTSWFDLCPDGTVRPYSVAGPCTSTDLSLGTATASHAIMGWTKSGSTWFGGGALASAPGTYYAHQANIEVALGGPNVDLPSLTLVAAAANPGDCATKTGGNIKWKKFGIHAPHDGSTWMLADSDIYVDANISFGDPSVPIGGMFAANDQIRLETSSSDVVGSVVNGDICKVGNEPADSIVSGDSQVNNLTVYFAPNSDAPFSSIITTTLWLDYTGA